MSLFQHLWIIARQTGVCIFEAQMSSTVRPIDADLISGFFSAMLSIGREITKADVKSVKFGNMTLLFTVAPSFLIVLSVTRGADLNKSQDVLSALEYQFDEKYSDILEREWNGDVTLFAGFSEILEKITKDKISKDQEPFLLGKQFDIEKFQEKLNEKPHPVKGLMTDQLDRLKQVLSRPKSR